MRRLFTKAGPSMLMFRFLGEMRMARKKISSTELVWLFHEKLKEFDDHPQHGISVAIVPEDKGEWRAVTTRNVKTKRPLWAGRVQLVEKRLRKDFSLIAD